MGLTLGTTRIFGWIQGSGDQRFGGYHAIDPDQPRESEALKRLRDQEDPMPPVDADRQLTEKRNVYWKPGFWRVVPMPSTGPFKSRIDPTSLIRRK